VHASVDLAALARLANSGEMSNRADWRRQTGVVWRRQSAEVVSLL
jgi:hypothetical protein